MYPSSRFNLPVIEHAGHSYLWIMWGKEFQGARSDVIRIEFSQARDEFWWFRWCRSVRYGYRTFNQWTPWLPVLSTDFELPAKAKLQTKTAYLPQMTPKEWIDEKRRQHDAEQFDRPKDAELVRGGHLPGEIAAGRR